eukprot:1732943-Prymnesium_polylepis.1
MDEDENFLDMLAKQDMNFMAELESDDAQTWAELPYPPSGTIVGHSGRSNESIVGSDDEEFPLPPPLSNSDELAQMMSESTIDGILRASARELKFDASALSDVMAPGGTIGHPNQPANVRDMPPGTFGFQVGSHSNEHKM